MKSKKELIAEINLVRRVKEKGDFYDEFDKWACFGYLHALLFVNGAIKSKYNKGE